MPTAIKHPSFDRTCTVMPEILRVCKAIPRGYGYLEKNTGASRGSLHVLCARLRERGLLEAINPGTPAVKLKTTPKGAKHWQ